MTINEAIKKAVEGGWQAPYGYATFEATENYVYFYPKHGGRIDYPMGFVLLDPLFWSALGKSLNLSICEWECVKRKGNQKHCPVKHQEQWLNYWHNFINHLALGKDAESWFEKFK